MISKGRKSLESLSIPESTIAAFYLGITKIPCVIKSPLRIDNKPSMSIFSTDGIHINYLDFSTHETGRIWKLLSKMWHVDYAEISCKILKELQETKKVNFEKTKCSIHKINSNSSILQCKVREWKDYDIEYWESYGVNIKLLKFADVFPVSHKIISKNNHNYIFKADKYAYAYVEYKEGKVTLKIYQPFNKNGHKWSNKHDKSVISLWTKVPKVGEKICICSSLKDALCLWSNTKIPAIATQGEGYTISNTAINELKRRYKKIYILFDNDNAGLLDGEKLSQSTEFINIVLPKLEEYGKPKDISDLYYNLQDKSLFNTIITPLFK